MKLAPLFLLAVGCARVEALPVPPAPTPEPTPLVIATETPAVPRPRAVEPYVVEVGDTLWSIAAERMGDPLLWPLAWNENRDQMLHTPHYIYPGQMLRIPLEYATEEDGYARKIAASEPDR